MRRHAERRLGSVAEAGASSLEIGAALSLTPESIRAKLNKLGVALRKRVLRLRVRMVLDVTRAMRRAAQDRGIRPQQLIRRLLQTISRNDLFDQILPLPPVRVHSLSAAAVHEVRPMVIIITQPQLSGLATLRG
jgi:hypothetical protein